MDQTKPAETAKLSIPDRYSYFLECHIHAREETFFRLRERSKLFYVHLFVQVTILALAFGVQLGQFKPPGTQGSSLLPFSLVLILAVPSAFVFATLYTIEDYLVDFGSRHLAHLSHFEEQWTANAVCIPNFDRWASRHFAQTTIPLRFQAQVIGFVIIPAIEAFFRFYTGGPLRLTQTQLIEASIYVILLFLILFRLIRLYIFRRRSVDNDAFSPASL